MASVASQLMEEVTAHAQSDSLEDAREIFADGTYFPNNLRITNEVLEPITFVLACPIVSYIIKHSMTPTIFARSCGHPEGDSL